MPAEDEKNRPEAEAKAVEPGVTPEDVMGELRNLVARGPVFAAGRPLYSLPLVVRDDPAAKLARCEADRAILFDAVASIARDDRDDGLSPADVAVRALIALAAPR